MTKKIKKLEKETTMYRSRWESSNKALLEMAEEVRRLWLLCAEVGSCEWSFHLSFLLKFHLSSFLPLSPAW